MEYEVPLKDESASKPSFNGAGPDDTFEYKRNNNDSAAQMQYSSAQLSVEADAEGALTEEDLTESQTSSEFSISGDGSVEDSQSFTMRDSIEPLFPPFPAESWTEQLVYTSIYNQRRAPYEFKRKMENNSAGAPVYDFWQMDKDLFGSKKKPVVRYPTYLDIGEESLTNPQYVGLSGFKPRWGNGTIFNVSKGILQIYKVFEDATTSPAQIQKLNKQLALTDFYYDDDNIPGAFPSNNLRCETFCDPTEETNAIEKYENAAWKLSSILFDQMKVPLPESANDSDRLLYISQSICKDRLSVWLKEQVVDKVQLDLRRAQSRIERVYAYLTGLEIENACSEALQNKDLYLATLLPLAGGDGEVKADLKNQIADWRESGALASIGVPYRAVFEILSGNVDISIGIRVQEDVYAREFAICENLDWMRAFALRLWYECPLEAPLEHAVTSFTEAFTSMTSVQRPVSWYGAADRNALDLTYLLLRLYSDHNMTMDDVLLPGTYSANILDLQLAWQLHCVISSAQGIRDMSDRPVDQKSGEKLPSILADQVSLGTVEQLEASGAWQWALFVALHIEHSNR